MTVRELIVKLGIDADQSGLEAFEDQLGKVKETAGSLIKALTAAAAAYASVGAAASKAAINLLEYSEEVARNSEAMGLASDKYQQFRFAFKNLNASTDDMMDAFSTVTDRAVDALEGTESYRKEFERLGISMDEIRGKKPGEIFERYMNAAQGAANQTDKVTAAVRLFGDDLGRRILPALTSSTESFSDLMARARRAGVVIPDEEIQKAREIRFEFRELKGRLSAIWREIGLRVLPIFTEFMRKFQTFLEKRQISEDFFEAIETLMRSWAEDIRFVLEVLGDLGDFFSSVVGGDWEDHVETVITAFKVLGIAIISALSIAFIKSVIALIGFITVPVAAIAAKVALVAAIATAIVLTVQDFIVYLKGGNSVIGEIVERFGNGIGLLDQFVRTLEDSKPALKSIWEILKNVSAVVIPMIVESTKLWFGVMIDSAKAFLQVGLAVISAIMIQIEGAIQFVQDLFTVLTLLFQGQWAKAWEATKTMFRNGVESILEAFMALFSGTFRALLRFGLSVVSRLVSSVANLIRKIPGIGDAAADQLEKLEAELNASLKTKRPETVDGASRRQRQAQQTERVARESFVMFGRQGFGGGKNTTNNQVDESSRVEQEVNTTINVEGDVTEETKRRIDDSAEKANRDAAAQLKGGKR